MRMLTAVALFAVALSTPACLSTEVDGSYGDDDVSEQPGDGDYHGEVDEEPAYYDELGDGLGTVQSQLRRCNTGGVMGLSQQIIDEIDCISPGALVRLDPAGTHISFQGSAVLPYFADSAHAALMRVGSRHYVSLVSGYRTIVQQLMIYEWRRARRCHIRAAAVPGRSNHESGRAVDLGNASSLVSAMRAEGWVRNVRGDYVHFERTSSPDLRGLDVIAFQRLWNRNHPEATIAEDGDWGPATRSAMLRSPAEGFAVGAQCAQP